MLDPSINVELIGQSAEKFFAVMIGPNLMFLDSNNFFQSSLDKVVNSLNKQTAFPLTRKFFEDQFKDPAKVELMLKKGTYPYDYMTSVERYKEEQLPPPEAFHNELYQSDVTEEEYQHAQTVWNELGVKNLGEYTRIYNMQDTLLLLDAFNNLRGVFYSQFGIDPLNTWSLPHLTWQCMLKYTGISF